MDIKELLVTGDLDLLIHQHPDKNYINPIKVEIHVQQAYYFYVDEEPDGKPWYYDIKRLLGAEGYLEGATSKRTPDLGLLQCVNAMEATRLLEEIHAGTSGPHMNGFMLAKKFWELDTFG
ncbi:uncharacterized protein LOC124889610 [Capsicum annuum]|uniref:uncharacterized protein LOC124889610 n=1 Tax=Capsicum annuum TaxID=4072 RepID=UPI001FB0E3A9|nr:uncharacterized protein LOC124889610 [Capsicum annuum]